MNKRIIYLVCLAILSLGCERGDLGTPCNKDGSCNFDTLQCIVPSNECQIKPPPPPPAKPKRCDYESECFCMTCADKCGPRGVKKCAYSDTSVWGSDPAICECAASNKVIEGTE